MTSEKPPSLEDQRAHARETAKKLAPDIQKEADCFVEKLDNMAEEELANTDIVELALDAEHAIDACIASKPLKLKGWTLSDQWLEGPRNIIADARTEALAKIEKTKENYERMKSGVLKTFYNIQNAENFKSSINQNIQDGLEKIRIIFTIGQEARSTTDMIKRAGDIINELKASVGLNTDAIGKMQTLANELKGDDMFGLIIASIGAEKIGNYATTANRSNSNFKEQLNAALQYLTGLRMEATANGKQDAKLFDEAKAMREAAKKYRASLPSSEIEIPEDDQPYEIPQDAIYGPERAQEEQKNNENKPLPEVSNNDAQRVIKLNNGSRTSIAVNGKNITISKNANGEYETPDGSTFHDAQKVLFNLRMKAWNAKYTEKKASDEGLAAL